MVGIVIVSHSATLAEGVRQLAEQMTQGRVPIAVAGGIDDPENPIGTDPIKVMTAIEEVEQGAGVLVLMDLGSALMSAETALDLLPPEVTARVRLTAAPLVEGAMAAAVQASIGADIETVFREASESLVPKAAQLGIEPEQHVAPASAISSAEQAADAEFTVVVPNVLGLHARPAARIVSALGSYEADVRLCYGDVAVNAKSLNQIATLAVRQGDIVRFTAIGTEASQALQDIATLAADNFGDIDAPQESVPQGITAPSASDPSCTAVCGIPASSGPAVGPVVLYRASLPDVECISVTEPAPEVARLEDAVVQARQELTALERKTASLTGSSAEAEIFAMHRMLLDDPFVIGAAHDAIRVQACNAEAAWHDIIVQMAERYLQLEDEYMQARAADVIDVGARVLRVLTGAPMAGPALSEPGVLVASDLGPSDMATLDPAFVLGIVTEHGGATSHAAILARSLGIPAVVGAGSVVADVAHGSVLGLDGDSGELWIEPNSIQQEQLAERRASWLAEKEAARSRAFAPAETKDGKRVHIAANIGLPADAVSAAGNGAEGIGLFRTEFLFLDRNTAPSEAEQVEAYTEAARALGGLPLIIRTLDIGGDKPVAYLEDMAVEENPFLGKRGIRFCLAHKELFIVQLRALLQVAATHPVKIMFPMVAYPGELKEARAVLEEVRTALQREGLPCADHVPVGIMIEVPSAVMLADQLAREADFFSIGTNDLAQYVMAADRGNAAVSGLSDALHPAVLKMIQKTVEAAHAAGIPVGMCGELAGRPLAIPVLVGLGLDELSMNSPAIPQAKDVVRNIDLAEAQALAASVLALSDAEAVKKALYTQEAAAGSYHTTR